MIPKIFLISIFHFNDYTFQDISDAQNSYIIEHVYEIDNEKGEIFIVEWDVIKYNATGPPKTRDEILAL